MAKFSPRISDIAITWLFYFLTVVGRFFFFLRGWKLVGWKRGQTCFLSFAQVVNFPLLFVGSRDEWWVIWLSLINSRVAFLGFGSNPAGVEEFLFYLSSSPFFLMIGEISRTTKSIFSFPVTSSYAIAEVDWRRRCWLISELEWAQQLVNLDKTLSDRWDLQRIFSFVVDTHARTPKP